jgi:RNA polymerase sigma factor (sigma-70 family)
MSTALAIEPTDSGVKREKTDRLLLARFVEHQDQAAFAELVARHGGTVWGVCRRVLWQEQDAEDAFQAVFLLLGRKAGSIRRRESVGSWLYGVAYRTALRLRRTVTRRQGYEQKGRAPVPEPAPADQAAARELQQLLDEEVSRLSEKYRAPFVLCCLEGLSRADAAQELGWREGTVSSRVAQARELLKSRLARQGFTFSAVLTACALGSAAAAAAPTALMQTALQAGMAAQAGAAFAPAVTSLANGIAHALLVTKLKTAAAVVAALAVVTAAGGVASLALGQVVPEQRSPQPAPPAQPVPAAPPAAGQAIFVGQVQLDARQVPANRPGARAGGPGIIAVPAFKPNDVWSVAISRDGKYAAAGAGWWDQPGEVGLWDLASRKLMRLFNESRGVASVAFSPDGKLLAWGSWNGHVRLRDRASGAEVADFDMPGVSRVAFSPDGKYLAGAAEGKIVRIWDVASHEIVCELEGDLFRFHCIAFTPDGKRLLAGGGDWKPNGICQVNVWDFSSKKQVLTLKSPDSAILAVAVSPDGSTIASGGLVGVIHLWDAASGKKIKTLPGHKPPGYQQWVHGLAFSPDSKTLVSGGMDRTIRFWDVAQGKETRRVEGGPPLMVFGQGQPAGDVRLLAQPAGGGGFLSSVRDVCFTPDGQTLLVGGGPKSLRLYDVGSTKENARLWESTPGIVASRLPGLERLPGVPVINVASGETGEEEPQGKPWLMAVLAVAVLTLAAGLVLLYYRRRRSAADRQRGSAEPAPAMNTRPAPLTCPGCGKKLRVRGDLTGKKLKCPQCGKIFGLPETAIKPKEYTPSA